MIRIATQHDSSGQAAARDEQEEAQRISLCSFSAGSAQFGIDTRRIREVLGRRMLQPVPLAPAYIGGVVPYRGEVLTAISFRALLGLPAYTGESAVLVLDEEEDGEHKDSGLESFGLMVDGVGGVVTVRRSMFAPNPATLDERSKVLFNGAYRMAEGLLVQLDPRMLRPARLSETGLFRQVFAAALTPWETPCAH